MQHAGSGFCCMVSCAVALVILLCVLGMAWGRWQWFGEDNRYQGWVYTQGSWWDGVVLTWHVEYEDLWFCNWVAAVWTPWDEWPEDELPEEWSSAVVQITKVPAGEVEAWMIHYQLRFDGTQ